MREKEPVEPYEFQFKGGQTNLYTFSIQGFLKLAFPPRKWPLSNESGPFSRIRNINGT